MLCASLDKVAPARTITANITKNPSLKNCQSFGRSRAAILSRFFWQILLKRNFAFKPPRNSPATAASQGQSCSGFSASASTSRLPPFSSSIMPPTYQTRAAKILRLRVDTTNIGSSSIYVGQDSVVLCFVWPQSGLVQRMHPTCRFFQSVKQSNNLANLRKVGWGCLLYVEPAQFPRSSLNLSGSFAPLSNQRRQETYPQGRRRSPRQVHPIVYARHGRELMG